MDQLYMLRAFVAVAQHRSFSKAAASLGVTTGSISKAIAKLEESIQTLILHRTTRSVSVTDAAQSYYLSCCRLLDELDEANRRIAQEREIDSGRLRLVVHPMLVNKTFSRLLSDYQAIAPNVNLMVSVREEAVNLYDGHFDMAILPPHLVEQSGVIRRTLSRSRHIFVAAPGYLERCGTPEAASDLASHFLLLDPASKQKGTNFIDLLETGKRMSVLPMSSMDGNEVLLRAAALTGTGIATISEAMVREDIAAGHLTHILPQCSTSESGAEVCLFYSHRELLPVRLRTFVDFCIDFFRSLPGPIPNAMAAIPQRLDRDVDHALTAV
ncbi:LysR family transcriptional regulator [Paraburkholderia sp. NPDC080076]|jgi:DNA-binding transcriptional LysR family regulator|uniref:LysR family transcriptional regulator n=1 Tax=Paraburkholderia sp. NPDC080076 TaxID=3390605 RepID=UPI003CFC504E